MLRRASLAAALLALVVLGRPCVAGDEPADDFGVKEARLLIPRAAAIDGPTLEVLAALGASVTPSDMHAGSVSLSIALLLIPAFHAPDARARDFRTLSAFSLTATDYREVFYGSSIGAGRADRKHDFASALHDEYLTMVSCTRTGETAHGEVTFTAPGAYEGRAEWTASRADGRWRVDAFVLPSWGLRVARDGERWRAVEVDDPSKPWRLSAAQLAVPSAMLVRAGAVWDAPEEPLEIALAEDGTIRFLAREVGLEDLRQNLRAKARDPRLRNPDGSSKIDVVLRVAPALPWPVVSWVMQVCIDPNVSIYRLHFAVMPEPGGVEGVIPAFLPRDGGPVPTPPLPVYGPRTAAFLFASDGTADRGAVFAALQASMAAMSDKTVLIDCPPPKTPRAGHVLTVVDLALRAGATRLMFQGTALPHSIPQSSSEASSSTPPEVGSVAWLRAWVAAATKGLPAGVKVRVGNATIDASSSVAPLPPPPPRHARFVDEGSEARGGRGFRDVGGWTRSDGALVARFRHREGAVESDRDSKADEAVERALAWLAAHQAPDGGWEAAGFGQWCDGKSVAAGGPDGVGNAAYDVGTTGLALLAFLGAGYTNRSEGPYGRVVGNGLKYLRNEQDAEGCFGARTTPHFVYSHAIATLALVECFGMTGSSIYKSPAQRGLDFISAIRNPGLAWRYGVKPGDNDTSITGWMTLALSIAKRINDSDVELGRAASLTIDAAAFAGAHAWIAKVTDAETGRVGYQLRGTGPARPADRVDAFPNERSESLTAIGVLLRVLLGEDPASSDAVKKGAALMAALPPVWNAKDGSIDLYYWQAGALALQQVGGTAAEAWRAALSKALVEHQRVDGEPCGFKGSWDPIDPWGPDGGRMYMTAMAALALEAPYRYPRVAATARK